MIGLLGLALLAPMKLVILLMVLLVRLLQENTDILAAPIVIAILALLGIPSVTVWLATGLRYLTDRFKIDPRVPVYIASSLVTALVLAVAGSHLPAWTGDPAAYVTAWQLYLVTNAELARRLYEVFWEKIGLGRPDPTKPPEAVPAPGLIVD